MDEQFSLTTLLVAVLTSFVGSWLFFRYQRGQEARVRQKIAELEYEEKFIEKLSKGNVELIRSGFRTISFALFLVFAAGAGVQVTNLWPLPKILVQNIHIFSFTMWAAAAATCLSYFRTLIHLNNLEGFKAKIRKKRESLEKRL